jgi:hypothetical protein
MRKRLPLVAAGLAVVALVGAAAWQWQRREFEHRSHTVTEAVRKVAKLSTVEMSLSNWQKYSDSKDLFGFIPIRCQKTMAVFYRGKVAAGFDLAGTDGIGMVVTVTQGSRRVKVELPRPRLLYTDVPAPEVVVADGSLCNQVTPDDYTRLHQEARSAIEREAIAAGVLRRAETNARELIDSVLRPLGLEPVIVVGGETEVKSEAATAAR